MSTNGSEYKRHQESRDVYDLIQEKGVPTANIAQAMDKVKQKNKVIKKDKIIALLKRRGES